MRFAGLDTFCKIEVNGKDLGTVDNMHRTYDFEVKTKLELGMNTLKLIFSKPQNTPEVRRAYATFGKEGSHSLYDMGIFRKIEIIAFNHKIISDVKIKQTHGDKYVRLDIKIDTLGYDEMSRTVATMTSPAGNVYFCGFVGGEGSITVTDPNLWWPKGLGMQNLYKLNVNLYSDSDLEDTREIKIGLRRMSVRSDNGKQTLLINDVPMFVMGAEYMLGDVLLPSITEERTRALLEDAADASFNTVFIHGSGLYPENYFFNICDELGLLTFMQLPVSNKKAEDTEAFKNEIKAELKDNLTRMANHPSLGVIVGNDRVNRIFDTDEERARFISDFAELDGGNVLDLCGECYKQLARVGHDSLPTYNSILNFTTSDNRNLGSKLFELHGADSTTVNKMLSGALEEYPYANGMKELSYVTGLYSAEASMREAQTFRRESVKPMGVLMRSMNDPWPSLSPSAVDYYGGRKPLHYYEREFFAPVRISVVVKGSKAKFVVTNDMRQDYVGVFAYAIMNAKNKPMFRDSFPIRAKASSNLEVHNVDLGSVISSHENEYYLLYTITDKINDASKGIYLFTKIKRFKFLQPNFEFDVTGNGTQFVATIAADCFAKGVEISFDGVEATVDRNYFDLTGTAPVQVQVTTPRITTVEKLKRVMRIRSVYDLGREN
jgi:beta-mannosidase